LIPDPIQIQFSGRGSAFAAMKLKRPSVEEKLFPCKFICKKGRKIPRYLPPCIPSGNRGVLSLPYPPIRLMAICGRELACASMAMADWVRIWFLTKLVISRLTSVSEILDSEA